MLSKIFNIAVIALIVAPPVIFNKGISAGVLLDFTNLRLLAMTLMQALSSLIIVIFSNKLNIIDYTKAKGKLQGDISSEPRGALKHTFQVTTGGRQLLDEKGEASDVTFKGKSLNKSTLAFYTIKLHLNIGTALVTFGALVLTQVLLQLCCTLLNVKSPDIAIEKISGFGYVNTILVLILSAAHEELLYRVFLVSAIRGFFTPAGSVGTTTPNDCAAFNQEKNTTDRDDALSVKNSGVHKVKDLFTRTFVINTLSIVGAALLFALPHRYEGVTAVVNAFIAHFILYGCYQKVLRSGSSILKSASYGTAAHFLYNIFFLLANMVLLK